MAEWLMNNLDKVIIPLITSLLTYFAAVYKGRNELKKQVQTNKLEIEKLMTEHKLEMEKLEKQIESQQKLYEEQTKNDFAKDAFMMILQDPKKLIQIYKAAEEQEMYTEEPQKYGQGRNKNHPRYEK